VFCLAIYLEPPCTLSPKPWFRSRPTQEKLRPDHVLAPQLSMVIDPQYLGDSTQSMTVIYLIFLLPLAIPYLHYLSTRSFLPNHRLRLIPVFRSLGVSTLKPCLPMYVNISEFHNPLTHVPFLDQWSRSASLLQALAISILNLHALLE